MNPFPLAHYPQVDCLNSTHSTHSSSLVRLEQVSKVYGAQETEVQALRNVNLTVQQGEYCAIVGRSGSGKSTVISIMGCLDRPTRGRYYLNQANLTTCNDSQLAEIRNRQIGFVFQQFHLLLQLTALENVMLPLIYAGVDLPERRERAIAALQQVGLENRLQATPNQLSGGQQQRVAIARAIVNQPLLLLADEPTGALDSRTTQDVMQLFSTLNANGITVIIVTHDLEVAQQTDRLIEFQDGQIVAERLL